MGAEAAMAGKTCLVTGATSGLGLATARGSGVTANAVHPGLVRTRLGDHSGPVRRAGWHLLQVAYRRSSLPPEQGADTIVHLAASPEVAGITGRYFVDRAQVAPAPAACDDAAAERLWAVSEQLTATLAEAR